MENIVSFLIGRKTLHDITGQIFNTDRVLKAVGAFTLVYQTVKLMGWDKQYVMYLMKKIPYIKEKIYHKRMEIRQQIKDDLNDSIKGLPLNLRIPEKGLTETEIFKQVDKLSEIITYDGNSGRISGCVYSNSMKLDNLMAKIYPMFERTNPLHPDIFPGVRKMEAEIVNMCSNLMYSTLPEAGCFTTGGTESILLAMRSYKKIAQERGFKGKILLAKSAHAAYWKAAEYFDMDVIEIETNFLPLDDVHVENNITEVLSVSPSY